MALCKFCLLAGLLVASTGAQAAVPDAIGSSKFTEISQLGWEFEAGAYKLPISFGTLRLKAGLAIVRGDHARRMVLLSQGQDFPEVEAVLVDPQTASGIIFTYLDSGYVRIDDWTRINKGQLLNRIRQVTADSNHRKSESGLSPVTIKGWLRAPTLDIKANSVSWAIEAMDGATPIVNAVTLKLGKSGFEKLTWIGRRDHYLAKKGLLEDIRTSLEFSPGNRYGDFAHGDPQAEFGIATLVAAAVGAQPALSQDIGSEIWALIRTLAARPLGIALLAGAVLIVLSAGLVIRRRRSRQPLHR